MIGVVISLIIGIKCKCECVEGKLPAEGSTKVHCINREIRYNKERTPLKWRHLTTHNKEQFTPVTVGAVYTVIGYSVNPLIPSISQGTKFSLHKFIGYTVSTSVISSLFGLNLMKL